MILCYGYPILISCLYFFCSESEQSTEAQQKSDAQARTEAAVKIQAAFRGHKVRMNLQKDDSNTCILPETEAEIEGTISRILIFFQSLFLFSKKRGFVWCADI